MISIDTQDLYVIYSKSSSGMSLTYDDVFITREDAEKKMEECRETSRRIEERYLEPGSNLTTKFFVSTLEEFITGYGEYMRWEGENEAED